MNSRLSALLAIGCITTLFAIFGVFADSPASPYTWAQTYGVGSYDTAGNPSDDPFYGSGTDYPVGIARMPDGGAVVTGQLDLPKVYAGVYISHTGANAEATLVRYGSDGAILWQRTLHQTNDRVDDYGYYYPATSRIYQILTDSQGNIFVCGGKGNSFNSGQSPFVAKFSSDGALVWQNGWTGATATVSGEPPVTYPLGVGFCQYMSLTNDGGVLVSSVESRLQGYTVPTLVKFDANGVLSMYSAYEHPAQYASNSPVAQSKDGTHYVFISPSSDNSFNAIVTDTSGTIVSQRHYEPNNGTETPRAIIATSDGGFASLSWLPGLTSADAFVIRKFNSDLSQETFEKVVRSAFQNSIFSASSIVEASDGGFLIGGHSSAYSEGIHGGGYEAAIMKIKNDGTLQFVSLLGGPQNEMFDDGITEGCALVPTTDGGYAFTVATYSYSIDSAQRKPDWWIVKTDANRRVAGFGDLMIDQGLDKYRVTDTTSAPSNTTAFSRVSYSVSPTVDANPTFQVQDTAANTGINKPTKVFQAAVAGGPTPVPTCDPGMTDCGGVCVNLQTDSQNCGTCGNNCPPGTTCSNGGCVPIVVPTPALSIIGKVTSTSDPVGGHFAHTGDKLDYVLTFANSGGTVAPNLRVSTTIPSYIETQTNLVKQFALNQLQISPGYAYVPASAPNVRDAQVVWTVGNLGPHLQNFVRLTIPSLASTVRTEQSIRLPNDYSVYSGAVPPQNPVTGLSSGAPNLETHIEGTIKCTLAANSTSVSPGGQLSYTLKVTNTAGASGQTPPHAIAVVVQPEFTNYVSATVTPPSGATFTPVTKLAYVSGQSDPQVVMDLGPLSGGKSFTVRLTFEAQWADPVENPRISTLDYGASFLPEAGVYPPFKTALASAKKTPPGGPTDFMSFVTSVSAVATSRQDSGQIDTPLQGSLALQPLLDLSKSISDSINGAQGNGNGRATDFVKPGDLITFVLTGENHGRTGASDAFIQDGLPDHTQFVNASQVTFVPGVGARPPSFTTTAFTPILDDQGGHHIRFTGLRLNAGERVTLTYTVRVDSGASAPTFGTFINSDACSIGSSNTVHTPPGIYQNGPVQIIGEALVLAEPKARAMIASPQVSHNIGATADALTAKYKRDTSAVPLTNINDPLSYIPGVQRYYAHYENAGTVAVRSIQLNVPLPAHTVFYRAAFVSLPASTQGELGLMPGTVLPARNFPPVPAGWGINTPPFLSSGGTVTFTFDQLPAATKGDVMVEVIVTEDAIQRNASIIGDITNVTIQDGAGSSVSASATQAANASPLVSPNASSRGHAALTVTPIADPNRVPQVGILKTVPQRVLPGSTFDVYLTIFNKGSYACATPLVNFTVPQGTTFISAEYGQGRFFNNSNSSAPGSVMSFFMASNNGVSYGIDPLTYLDPHTAASIKITLKATAAAGTKIPDSHTDLVAIFAGDIVAPPVTIDVVGSLTGLVDTSAPGWMSSITGAPVYQVVFNNGVVNLIDIGGNNIVAQGGGNIVAQGGGNIVAQGGGNIVASGAGNLIPIGVTNAGALVSNISSIVAQGAGNILVPQGSTIVATGGGNIVASGAGNIVAQGGGNIVAQGGGNIVAQGGGNAISLPISGLVGRGAGQIVAQGGGNIVAQGGGNIVAQGGGNIVAAGAGNIISGNGSAILASTPDSAAMLRTAGNMVTTSGGSIVAQGGGN